jgi:hypothetical protein
VYTCALMPIYIDSVAVSGESDFYTVSRTLHIYIYIYICLGSLVCKSYTKMRPKEYLGGWGKRYSCLTFLIDTLRDLN